MTTIELLLSGHTAEIQHITQQLRQIVQDVLPEAREKVYMGWHAIGFQHPKAGYIGGIFPYEKYVRLLFEKGVMLYDPDHELQGNGKQTRYLEISDQKDISPEVITRFLHAAINL